MSGAMTAVGVALGATGTSAAAVGTMATMAAVGTAATIYTGNKQASEQRKATSAATANAEKQAIAADQAMNAANQKRPDTNAILDAATQSGRAGVSGTMLTGAQGVDKNAMALGRNTLLGQ